jgi:hypothetical protein
MPSAAQYLDLVSNEEGQHLLVVTLCSHSRGFDHAPSPGFRERSDFPERRLSDFPEPTRVRHASLAGARLKGRALVRDDGFGVYDGQRTHQRRPPKG